MYNNMCTVFFHPLPLYGDSWFDPLVLVSLGTVWPLLWLSSIAQRRKSGPLLRPDVQRLTATWGPNGSP